MTYWRLFGAHATAHTRAAARAGPGHKHSQPHWMVEAKKRSCCTVAQQE